MQRRLDKRRVSEEEIIKEKGLVLDYDEMARRGSMSHEEKAISKWYGIYASRKPGDHMARVVIPGGRIMSVEARAMARISTKYSQGLLSVTTRQAVQFHRLQLEDLGPFLRDLKAAGLSAFHGCGDVTRNVAACPWASICRHRVIDALPHAKEVAEKLTAARDLDNLPRKFKITVSGCGAACAQPHINCVGAVAVLRRMPDGSQQPGFRILIGGGMGWRPFQGQDLFTFVPPGKLTAVCRAVALLFRDHGDRYVRMYARLKFIVHRYGIDKCREIVYENLDAEGIDRGDIVHEPIETVDSDIPSRPLREPQPIDSEGFAIVRIKIPKGELTAEHFARLADLSEIHGDKNLYTTNRQNIELHGIKPERVDALRDEIAALGLETSDFFGLSDIVSCVGTTYCPLAVTHTHTLFDDLSEVVREQQYSAIRDKAIINITGCPNSCSPYRIADIGFRGMRIREQSGAVESYQVSLGGEEDHFGDILGEFKREDCVRVVRVLLDTFMHLGQNDETLAENVLRLGMEPYSDAVARLGISYEKAVNPLELSVGTGHGTTPLDVKTLERDVPCRTACPAHTNIPEYIGHIAQGDCDEAHRVNQEDNVLPGVLGRICTRPCEIRCRYNWTNTLGPVSICHLKRSATDRKEGKSIPLAAWFEPSGKHVAVVGGGPAGLAAARELKRYGHDVTIYERENYLGGQIRIGVPEYRLPRDVLQEDIDAIIGSGIEVKLGESFDAQRVRSLAAQYDAVLLAIGANRPRSLVLDGLPEGAAIEGLHFMKQFNDGEPLEVEGDVVVIGGGFTAVDCVRSARRLIGDRAAVSVMYRRGEAQMAANQEELEAMRDENIRIETLVTPISARLENGRIAAVTFRRNLLGESTDGEKPSITPIEGSDFEIPCDTLVFAIGQEPQRETLPDDATIVDGNRTSIENLFVAGDFSSKSAADVINAVADGKRAAHAIDKQLMGTERREEQVAVQEAGSSTGRLRDHDLVDPPHLPLLPVAGRGIKDEVELGFDDEQTQAHAWRCYLCNHKFEIDQDKCIHCDWCIRVSPRNCILRLAQLELDADGAPVDWKEVPKSEPEKATYIWIDSDQCIRCGACINICPVDAISLRRIDATDKNCADCE